MRLFCLRFVSFILIFPALVTSCVRNRVVCETPCFLTAIHLVDRNGLSETLSQRDRLREFHKVDFMACQPYQKVMRVFSRASNGDVRAIITTYYENGQLKQYLETLNGRAYGYYREWHENGQMSLETYVIGGMPDISTAAQDSWLFDKVSNAWNSEGQLMASIPYCKGKLHGQVEYFHPSGKLWKRFSFNEGLLDGTHELFYSSGTLLQRSNYRAGKKDGELCRYWFTEALAAQERWSGDLLQEGTYYDKHGGKVAEVLNGNGYRAFFAKNNVSELHEYQQGIPVGEVRSFSSDGALQKVWHVNAGGEKHGSEVEFWNKPGLGFNAVHKLEVTWHEGKIQGLCRTWYDNGTPESQREMADNKKNGLLTAWYRDGTLMLVEEYEHDRLVRGEYYRMGEKMPSCEVVDGEGYALLCEGSGTVLRKVLYRHGMPLDID